MPGTKFFQTLALLAMPMLVGSCGLQADPASEPPVTIKAGLYSISYDFGAFGMAMLPGVDVGDTKNLRNVCIRNDEDERWIFKSVRETVGREFNCRTEDSKRTGNAISARVSCQLPLPRQTAEIALNYDGVMTDTGADLTGKLSIPEALIKEAASAEKERQLRLILNAGEVRMRFKREGDC